MVDWDWKRVVFDHVKLVVRDPAASVASTRPSWRSSRSRRSGRASAARSSRTSSSSGARAGRSDPPRLRRALRAEVDAFHRAGLEAAAGQRCARRARAVQLRRGGRYYAAFVLDPDGNNVEAVVREFLGRLAPARVDVLGLLGELERDAAAPERAPGGPVGTSAGSSSGGAAAAPAARARGPA